MSKIRLFTNNLILILVFKIPMITFVAYLLISSKYAKAINEIDYMNSIYRARPDSKFKTGSAWFWEES